MVQKPYAIVKVKHTDRAMDTVNKTIDRVNERVNYTPMYSHPLIVRENFHANFALRRKKDRRRKRRNSHGDV